MLRSSVAVHKSGRFNRERCDIAFADDVKYDRLIQLATLGVVIDTPANLVRGLPQDPPRRLTKRLQTVYSKATYDVYAGISSLDGTMSNLNNVLDGSATSRALSRN